LKYEIEVAALLGVCRERHRNLSPRHRFPRFDHRAMLRSVIETGEPVAGREVPVPFPTDPQQSGYFDFVFQAMRDPDGSIPGVFVYSAEVTEKVRARQELSDQQLQLDKTLATAEIATFDWAPQQDRVYANPLLKTFFGVSDEEAAGGHLAAYLTAIHPDDRARVRTAIEASLQTGKRYETEYRLVNSEGKERWVLARGDTTFGKSGPERLSGILVDITARKSIEAERERLLTQVEIERKRLEQAFDETPTFICLLEGPDLVFRYANEPYYGLIGFREVIGKPLAEALPEIEAQGFPAILRRVMDNGESWMADEVSVSIQRQPGAPAEERILNLRYVPVREADGTISGVYSHALDVTEAVAARRHLAESEERFRLGQRAGKVGTFEWIVPTGRVIWSPELEALYGVSEGTFEGKFEDWMSRVVPEDANRVVDAIARTIAERATQLAYEFRAVLPDGSHHWLAGQAQFDYDESGGALRMAGVNVDIHDRKAAEAELRASEQRFRIVAQATRDAVWDWDLRDNSVWWNEGISDLFGHAREDVEPTATWWVEHIHPDDRDRVGEGIHRAIDAGESNWQDEYRYAKVEKGEIARSKELNTVATMMAGAGALLIYGGGLALDLLELMKHNFSLPREVLLNPDSMGQYLLHSGKIAILAVQPIL
ncbi:PAS domain S-box protein, partial [bacterium]